MQGNLWSETVRNSAEAQYMIFPRLLALAERAWHKAPWESVKDKAAREEQKLSDWMTFANTLGHKELARLDKYGIAYRVPPPGAR
jgi:hexosaminidase